MTKGFFMLATMQRRRSAIAALLVSTAFATPAFALEADAFGQALKDFAKRQQLSLDYGNIAVEGSDVVVSGITMNVPDAPAADGFDLGEVRFQDVQDLGGGGYKVGKFGRDGISGEIADAETTFNYSIATWGVEGMVLPGESTDPMVERAKAGLFYDRIFIQDVKMSADGQEFLTLANAQSTIGTGSPVAFNATMDALLFDMTVPPDEALREWAEGTGYKQIVMDYDSEGTWDLEAGILDAPTNKLTMAGMGEINMALKIGGYTPALVDSLTKLSEQMSSADPAQQQAAGMQLMGLASQLQFGGFTMTYRDGGMTSTLLDYYAKENGQSREELIQQTVAVLPFALGQLGAPDLQAQIQEAVTSFLNDPKSLTVALQPDTMVAAPVLVGAAMSSPADLAAALNAKVTANEAGMME